MTPELSGFYFGQDEVLLLPVEELGSEPIPRLSQALVEELLRRDLAHEAWVTSCNELLAHVHAVTTQLAAGAAEFFPPPRRSNLIVLRGDDRLHPYFSPFPEMSVVLYASDLEPETGSLEVAAFHYLMAERLGQTKRVATAVLAALPYLLSLDALGVASFARGAARSTRPDRAIVALVAAKLPWLREVMIYAGGAAPRSVEAEAGASAPSAVPEGYARVRGTALSIPKASAPELQALVKELDALGERLLDGYFTRQRARSAAHGEDVVAFVQDERPSTLIVDVKGAVLWDPAAPDEVAALRAALGELGERPSRSLIADLRVVGRVTERFFACVRRADSFAVPTESLEEAGGLYIHQERRLLAYALEQTGLSPLAEEGLPFHRWLLAARAMHEWGHVAVEGGVIPVPPKNQGAFQAAGEELAALFARVVNQLPSEAQDVADAELRAMREEGTRLVDLPFSRMEDYRANLLCRRLLPARCVEAYVRVNVRPLVTVGPSSLRKLARYAYEAQYLWLSEMADPWAYLESATYFMEEYVLSGLVSHELARRLIACVGRVARAFEVDEEAILADAAATPLALER